MPGSLAAALAAPLREIQALVGPGPGGELGASLLGVRAALHEVTASADRAWRHTAERWSGAGSEAAAQFVAATVTDAEGLAERVGRLGNTADAAGSAVARAHRRLRDIVDGFETRAAALEPYLDSPEVVEELVADARRSLAEAAAVLDELRAELDAHAAEVTATSGPAPASAPAATTTPAAASLPFGGGSGGGLGSAGAGSPGGFGSPGGLGSTGGLGTLVSDLAESARPETPDAATFGDGVAVRLPDGSTATAPNAVAADAVRHALTQLGVPYRWGGTTPGVGLDCSGLTQWAYSEAGLGLPRLAQEQDVGAPVGAGDLRPGDLAVWDGHVAMIVGNGQMIEAGDPVKLSAIRTSNAGQGFQGFWRPTA
ncbi:C40 family peptidase [Mycolicibacterium flavescens]|uniref:Glycoside hydrolase n=1 Tax=Mycolicibacterium flavescens TaxID=1776 RepID=A0A1E3RH10_MYCFV|nr:C40 family peptidase [Mycolicibacterium flavescens]MCV7279267.1 C40 family peptidase [Mycolicibacterium flavescens]ODQ89119.1 glycoside hydrolase [Mycolicibacterium flavescens]